MLQLTELESVISRLSAEDRKELVKAAQSELVQPFHPNAGPQTDALLSEADILGYGGQAGGGKSALMVGCAAREHRSALILRREATQLDGLWAFAGEICGSKGWTSNKVEKTFTSPDGRVLKFAGLNEPDDWRKHAGIARDFYGFDEAAEFHEEQVSSLIGWLRSTVPGQRCRVILASNPPRGTSGEWFIRWFAPWLDPLFPNPASPGELRWAIRVGGDLEWVEGPGDYERDGEVYGAKSYTFIPSSLDDNPYLKDTNYRQTLQNLPEPLRSQLLYGNFLAGREDDQWQVIPSAWIDAAEERWRKSLRPQYMDVIGVDVAQGGPDDTVLAPLRGVRYDELVREKGIDTKDGPAVASLILRTMRNGALVMIDLTGGWGISARDHLKAQSVPVEGIVFSAGSDTKSQSRDYRYYNKRAELWWSFREALDPEMNAPEHMPALPPDRRLRAQLTAPRWTLKGDKVLVESKDEIRKRLGSSTDDADAVILAWGGRHLAIKRVKRMQGPPQVNIGYSNLKRRRHG